MYLRQWLCTSGLKSYCRLHIQPPGDSGDCGEPTNFSGAALSTYEYSFWVKHFVQIPVKTWSLGDVGPARKDPCIQSLASKLEFTGMQA